MWIEKTGSGKLRAVERYIDPLTENQKKVSVTIPDRKRKTLKEAEKLLEQKIKKLLEPKSDRLRLSELADLYLADCEKRLKPSTMQAKRNTMRQVTDRIGDIYTDKLTARAVSDRLPTAGQVKAFKAMMRWAYLNEYTDSVSYIDRIKTPAHVHKDGKKYLEADELSSLLDTIRNDSQRDLTEFLALTGLRIGEALALTLDDINIKERTISINKTLYNGKIQTPKTKASVREIYIQDDLLLLVRKVMKKVKELSLFTQCRNLFQYNGKPVNDSSYRHMLLRRGVHPHMLRHTHTALMAEQGVSLEVISRRLGHENSKITRDIYFHVTEKQREKDHEAIRKISIF